MPADQLRYDPYSYALHEDPYPVYARLRDEAPVYYDEARGFWALTRYDDVRSAVDDWETFSSREGITIERRPVGIDPMLIECDPPRHTELRGLIARAFTLRRVAALEVPIRALARRLVEAFRERRGGDVIGELAAVLPMAVIGKLLGVPEADHDELQRASDAVLHRDPDSEAMTPAGIEGAITLYSYFDALITERRREPRGDLVSALIAAEDAGTRLGHRDVLEFAFLLIIAGNETTTKLIGNIVSALDQHADARTRVVADATLVPRAIDETLRWDGSTQAMARVLTRDVELHGARMREATKVLLVFGSANRDERHWGGDADAFDLDRDTGGHLAFGHGVHYCIGAALARLEARVALEELLAVIGDFVVDRSATERVHSGNVRGFARLPIRSLE